MAKKKSDQGSSGASIDACRQKINSVDSKILELLSERRELSREIIQAKEEEQAPIRDKQREKQLLLKLIQDGRDQGLDAHYVTNLYHQIIRDSLRVQREYLSASSEEDEAGLRRVAYLGIEGSYSFVAAKQHFALRGDHVTFIGCPSYPDIVRTLESGNAEFGILPIENTTSGGINEVYDLLLHAQLSIIGEEKLRIEQCLAAVSMVTKSSLRKIYAHPQSINQCSGFLASVPEAKLEFAASTTTAAQSVRDSGDATQAAICNRETAQRFELEILEDHIANQKENYTRFLIVARKPREVDARIPCKTSLVMSTAQKAGALVEALLCFRKRGLNLTKLESRPIPDNAWEEMFYVDFEGNLNDEPVKEALEDLARVTRFIKVLGCYPSQDLQDTSVPPQALAQLKSRAEGEPATEVKATNKSAKKKSYRLASREHKAEDTVIRVRKAEIGGEGFCVIAGPCSVESREQIMACAREVKENGGHILRGGCFKPRTSPYSFQGLEWEGLEYLAEAGDTYDLPIVTEVLAPEDVEAVAKRADILQVGARNMQNFSLLKQLVACTVRLC